MKADEIVYRLLEGEFENLLGLDSKSMVRALTVPLWTVRIEEEPYWHLRFFLNDQERGVTDVSPNYVASIRTEEEEEAVRSAEQYLARFNAKQRVNPFDPTRFTGLWSWFSSRVHEDEFDDLSDLDPKSLVQQLARKPFGYVLRSTSPSGNNYPWMNTRWSDRYGCCGNFRRAIGDATVFKRLSTAQQYSSLQIVPVYQDPRRYGEWALNPNFVPKKRVQEDDFDQTADLDAKQLFSTLVQHPVWLITRKSLNQFASGLDYRGVRYRVETFRRRKRGSIVATLTSYPPTAQDFGNENYVLDALKNWVNQQTAKLGLPNSIRAVGWIYHNKLDIELQKSVPDDPRFIAKYGNDPHPYA